jgi:ABC-2 type transport system permease protein
MTTHALRDSWTMTRRNLLHLRRYPSLTIMLLAQPIVFLLLFVFAFGGTVGQGLPGGGGRDAYLDYLTPGIVVMAVASVALGTALSVATDMTTGIVSRFRTMAIARVSVLTGHVLGAMAQSVLAVVVVLGAAMLLGFRPAATVLHGLAVAGVLAAFAFALTWLTVALGLAARSVETASNTPLFLTLLPFLGSGFVPTETMPAGLRWFAEHQPFTPVMESTRGLLAGHPDGATIGTALAWCVVITVLSYLWSRRLYASRTA